ncbi:MAG: hypothetical protein ACFFDT_08680, partial [Candidatus Hodarchaeota archaeon]
TFNFEPCPCASVRFLDEERIAGVLSLGFPKFYPNFTGIRKWLRTCFAIDEYIHEYIPLNN